MDEERENLIKEMVEQVREAFKKSLIAIGENPDNIEVHVVRSKEEEQTL